MDRNIIGINGCAKDCHEAAVKGGWWHDDNGIKKIGMWVSYCVLFILRSVKLWKVQEKV